MTTRQTKIMTTTERDRFRRYEDSLRARGRKDSTVTTYASSHREFCRFWSQEERRPADLQQITGLDLRRWKTVMMAATQAPATVNARLIAMKGYAHWAVENRELTPERGSTIQAVPEVAIAQMGVSPLEPEAFRRFLRTVETHGSQRDQAVIALLFNGLRISEVAGLRVPDIEINSHRGTIQIRGEHVKRSAYREVPLSRQARATLKEYLDRATTQNQVFVGERGELGTSGIYKIVRRLGQLAGCDIHPHALRHEFSLRYLEANNNDLAGLRVLLGHGNINTTATHYAKQSLEALRGGVQRIEG